MIGYITGKIIEQDGDKVIVETKTGVGYEVNLVGVGDFVHSEVEFYIYTRVSENDISLWGFIDKRYLRLFRMLLDVSGVGLRTGQSIISAVGPEGIVKAVRNNDPKALKAPGVGLKTAERIIIDLRNKVDEIGIAGGELDADTSVDKEMVKDAIAGVVTLGYSESDVRAVLNQLDLSNFESVQDIIKELLKHV
jgi:Holliday junction DNA helicase RuvA